MSISRALNLVSQVLFGCSHGISLRRRHETTRAPSAPPHETLTRGAGKVRAVVAVSSSVPGVGDGAGRVSDGGLAIGRPPGPTRATAAAGPVSPECAPPVFALRCLHDSGGIEDSTPEIAISIRTVGGATLLPAD